MSKQTLTISAIVISWQGEIFLSDCLNSLIDDLKTLDNDLSYEIIVVDNGSTDRSKSIINNDFPSVILIENKKNLGFAKAVNIGMRAASGEYLYILNQDLKFQQGTASSLLQRMKNERGLGMIGPAYLSITGELLSSARCFPKPKHIIYDLLLLSRLFSKNREFSSWRMGWFDHKTEAYVDQPMGAVMLIPRFVIDRVGFLDESFPLFFNDVDYCRRMDLAGFKRLYYPEVQVAHYVGGSTRRRPLAKRIRSHNSILRYLLKYSKLYELPIIVLCGFILLIGVLLTLPFDLVRRENK